MEFIKMDGEYEVESINTLKRYLEGQIYSKNKKEIGLEFDSLPKKKFFKKIMDTFLDYKSCYLKMVKYEKRNEDHIMRITLHNGEELYVENREIIVGDIHEGAHIVIKSNVVLIGDVKGEVTLLNDDASIFATKFINAKIHHLHGLVKVVNGENILINIDELGGKIWHE